MGRGSIHLTAFENVYSLWFSVEKDFFHLMALYDRNLNPADRSALIPASRQRLDVATTNASARTSNLSAPIMLLTGHEAEIFTCKFHPSGQFLASGGFDRQIFFWNVYGECENFAVIKGHQGPIIEVNFSLDGSYMFSASIDKTGAVWDVESGMRLKKLKGHTSFVNSCNCSRRGDQMAATGSDDGTVKVWDIRRRDPVKMFTNTYQVTAVAFNDAGDQIFSAGIDNEIKTWDLRRDAVAFAMRGHTETVTGISLSPDGSYLFTNSMDNTVRIFDVRPYAPHERCLKIFQGVQHNFEMNLIKCSWSPDGLKVGSGSADRSVYIWDTTTRKILYKLPGHSGSVNEVHFHPHENIVASCSSDKKIFIGELQ